MQLDHNESPTTLPADQDAAPITVDVRRQNGGTSRFLFAPQTGPSCVKVTPEDLTASELVDLGGR